MVAFSKQQELVSVSRGEQLMIRHGWIVSVGFVILVTDGRAELRLPEGSLNQSVAPQLELVRKLVSEPHAVQSSDLICAQELFAQQGQINVNEPGGTAAMPPASMSDTSSAMPAKHRRALHPPHGKATMKRGARTQLTGNTADQLNREELSRLQAGAYAKPPAPPSPVGTGR
jgi:hypothetical protein